MVEGNSESQNGIQRDVVLAHLGRIVSSATFRDSPRLQEILSFLVRETLSARGSQIKEYTIGAEVYGRRGHDSSRQSIIRTAMGRLRTALSKYYEREGKAEGLHIEIRRGEYTPVFQEQCGNRCDRECLDSCAVLPFRDFRGEDSGSQLADSIADELIHRLTYMRGLKVVSRTSSFAFRDTTLDATEIARRLGVKRIVEGSLRSIENEMELEVGIVNAHDGSISWTSKFSGPQHDILSVQHRMADAVMTALRPAAASEGAEPTRPRLTAWTSYRLGRFHAERRTAEGWTKSIECYQRALKADQNYALAYTGLADSHILLANFGEMKPTAAMSIARESAEAALALDPKLAEAHCSLAAVRALTDWNWSEAEREFRLALQLSPSYAQAHHWYAHCLSHQLRADEAESEMMEALSLDPVSPGTQAAAGMIALEARRFDAAIKHFQEALSLADNYPFALWQMGLAHVELGGRPTGLAMLERAYKALPASRRLWACLGYAYARVGNEKQAARYLHRLQEAAHTRFVSPLDIALVHVGLGQTEQALTLIEQAADQRDNFVCWLASAPYWASLHAEHRFQAILERIGLPNPAYPTLRDGHTTKDLLPDAM